MNRLLVRLTIAFILLSQIPLLVIASVASFSVTGQFQQYTVLKNNMVQLGDIPQSLGVFYRQQGSWSGVEKAFPIPQMMTSDGVVSQKGWIEIGNISATPQPVPKMPDQKVYMF